ncbi:MAG: amino acid adenylation domain-containing protein [Oscillatoria princeps RMCB-10]|jgi:amino acid adenylation domain-containing protein|nr:amino acid adenylation domain-containing protein [Oscillatoria princeps RMCB-10]
MENTALDESVATGKAALVACRGASRHAPANTGRSQELQANLSYWRSQLSGSLPALQLPLLPGSPSADEKPARRSEALWPLRSLVLPNSLREALQALALQEGASLFEILLAAFKTLLHRYTGTEDIAVGCLHPGTGTAGAKPIVLPLRTRIDGNPSYLELLHRVLQVTSAAIAHKLPLDTLLEELQLSQTPPFQVMFGFQSVPHAPAPELPELSLLPKDGGIKTQKPDLSLWVTDTGQELIAFCECSPPTNDTGTLARMLGHFQTLLEGIAANPEQRIGLLPVLTGAERHQILVEWNSTGTEIPDICTHQLFEAQVERTPDAIAALFEDAEGRVTSLQYRQLNERANQLAHHLQALGVGPEVLVGICIERSLDMLVGLLGILKAGGAYLPLDPAYPQERLAWMLEDSAAPVILTQQHLVAALPKHQAQIVCPDADWNAIAQHSKEKPPLQARPCNRAYAIYTSGSTGKPKGVQIPHSAVVNFLQSMQRQPGLTGQDILLSVTTLSFDIAALELFLPLSVGARVAIVSRDIASDGKRLLETLASSGATVMQATPATWRMLLQAGWRGSPQLKILCGGESMPRELANQLLSRSKELWNVYGPTETTIWSTAWQVLPGSRTVPVGRPIANTEIYLLDKHLQPVPVGVPGELCIGGAGLSRGYLNRPDLTAEKFIPNPFLEPGLGDLGRVSQGDNFGSNCCQISGDGVTGSARLYKTGDLARYLPDGTIECLGRIDSQVKIRGYRIELGEIEAALAAHPGVRQAVVTAREDVPGDKRLVAYILPASPPASAAAQLVRELRALLKEKLPAYMVPNAFVLLEEVPLTPNGKVDRRALPSPDMRVESDSTFVAPRNPTEQAIANIFAEVLGLAAVGADDNFWELGGHSLHATLVISRLRDTFGIELPVRRLFEAPSAASLAPVLETAPHVGEATGGRPSPIAPVSRNQKLPLSFAQQGLWLLDRLEPGNPSYNEPTAIRLQGELSVPALELALSEIVRRHEIWRTTFAEVDGEPVQAIAPAPSIKLPVTDLGAIPESERDASVRQYAVMDVQKPFDLSRSPLVRFSLLRLSEEEHVLILSTHHIVYDGWSVGVLLRELGALYEAFCLGLPSPLPELPVQFADFAVWQRRHTAEVLESQLAYWRSQLGGSRTVLNLPFDRPRPAKQTFRAQTQPLALSKSLSEALKALSARSGVTLFMTLLAAFNTLLYRYTGEEDISVGTPVANRNRVESEGLIGFFTNTLVMRTQLEGNCTFIELLNRVREVALEAFSHQEAPFEKLVEELQPSRNLSQSPLFQVMFVLQNAPVPDVSALTASGGSLKLDVLKVHSLTAKFDLTLELEETPNGIEGWFDCSADLFDAPTIARIAGHFLTLLEGIAANPEQRIGLLPVLTPAERQQLSSLWNGTQTEIPDVCAHELFEAQVERTPDAVAVIFEDAERRVASVQYRQLNERANQLAHYLGSLGVGPDTIVGLYVERSLEMIVGMLGILKAGGAYLPLDPAYSKERLNFMLSDAGVPVLLTQSKLRAELPAEGARVICLDTEWQTVERESQENPQPKATADSLAYVIYTSGSTGKPKGVMISHRSLVNYTEHAGAEYGISPSDRILQFASISFDASAEEIYPCLTRGATLCLRTDSMLDTVSGFLQKCGEWGITVLDLPTAYWHELTASLEAESLALPPGVRLAIIGGEKASAKRLAIWRKHCQPVRLVNTYGPTEATIVAAMCDLSGESSDVPLIGRAVGNGLCCVLDRHLQPLPVGVPGELYIGGALLARGYLNRPDLTAEKFIPNPFVEPGLGDLGRVSQGDNFDANWHQNSGDGPHPTARLYKTGDLVRYLADGNLEFLGRADDQVKIRGFRIELGEIEAVLRQHPAAGEVAVTVREDAPGDKRLVAYVVPSPGVAQAKFPLAELRGFLKQKLPPYMVPSVFVVLEKMPVTPSGKVDRRGLPAPDTQKADLEGIGAAPSNPVEEAVAGIFAEVLGLEQVGAGHNFFELGGHSLIASQVVSRVRDDFGIELPLRSLFETPTARGLAAALLQDPANRLKVEKTAQLLLILAQLSDEEVQTMLEQKISLGKKEVCLI